MPDPIRVPASVASATPTPAPAVPASTPPDATPRRRASALPQLRPTPTRERVALSLLDGLPAPVAVEASRRAAAEAWKRDVTTVSSSAAAPTPPAAVDVSVHGPTVDIGSGPAGGVGLSVNDDGSVVTARIAVDVQLQLGPYTVPAAELEVSLRTRR